MWELADAPDRLALVDECLPLIGYHEDPVTSDAVEPDIAVPRQRLITERSIHSRKRSRKMPVAYK